MTSWREEGPLFPRASVDSSTRGHRFAIFKPPAESCMETPGCLYFPDHMNVHFAMSDRLLGSPLKMVTEGQTKPTEENAST